MLVSQYIYTACGKDRNGAFSVFSKSKDITDEESSEIREVMMYKTPSGLPYEPTEQEIEAQFPKKFGYFFLSSGRVCLAQACYVGRVYSDLDTRWGNYIIHAFVFQKKSDFAPYSFIEHTVFKRVLTRKEWHDDPIPDDLPRIEIPENGGMLSASEVESFLNEDRMDSLKFLIEAIINSSNESPVHFSDDHKNQKYWLKILNACLPKEKQNAVGVCTHFTNSLIPGNISSRIQIRVNRPDSAQFSYVQEAQNGRFAFDFSRKIIPQSVKPQKYAISIVKLLSSGIFGAVKFADDINKVVSDYSVNINEASDLINIGKADYSEFANAEELLNTISIVDRVGYETESIATNLWAKKSQFNFNAQQKLSVLAFIYKYTSAMDTKIEIIKTVLDNAQQLGITADNPKAFRDDLNTKAKFIFANYTDYLKKEGLINHITQNQNSFPKLFLVFDDITGLSAVKNSIQTRDYNASEGAIAAKRIFESAFKRSISDIDLLIESANSHMSGLGIELLFAVAKEAETHTTNLQFAFDILQRLRPKTEYAYAYLLQLIKTTSNQDELVKRYINAQNNAPDFYTGFENKYKQEPLVADFCGKKDKLYFESQQPTLKTLKEYFDKYYVVGKDSGLFVKRLREYLDAVQAEKKTNECVSILNTLKLPPNADKTLLPPIHCVVLEAIFSVQYSKIHDLCKEQAWFDRIRELYASVEDAGVSLKPETHEFVVLILCGRLLEKYGSKGETQALEFFKTQTVVDRLAADLDILNSAKSLAIFMENYFTPVTNLLIAGATKAKEFDYDGILEKVFGKFFEKSDLKKIAHGLAYEVRKSKANPIVFILCIFRKHLARPQKAFDKKLGDIAEKYFEELSSGDRKKTFSELRARAAGPDEVAKFESYFEEFNKTHKGGFFGSLFGKG